MKSFGILFALILLSVGAMQAQEALPHHPNDSIKLQIKLDGPDASKVTSVLVSLQMQPPAHAPANQVGFMTSFQNNNWTNPVAPNTFLVVVPIPSNVATGDYYLQIDARADAGSTEYQAGKQFQFHTIHVDNPKTFSPPRITVEEQP